MDTLTSNPKGLFINIELILNYVDECSNVYVRTFTGMHKNQLLFFKYNDSICNTSCDVLSRTGEQRQAVAAVLGLQIKYNSVYDMFVEMTSQCTGIDCELTCAGPVSVLCWCF